jgi:hypothetical protein
MIDPAKLSNEQIRAELAELARECEGPRWLLEARRWGASRSNLGTGNARMVLLSINVRLMGGQNDERVLFGVE